MHQYIILLSDLSYEIGLIGVAEYEERLAIADWLSGTDHYPDPRVRPGQEGENSEERQASHTEVGSAESYDSSDSGETADDQDRWYRLLVLNKWMFTVGDRDCYPSVPHGHLHSKTNKWPKLNPYSGRVFLDVHQEDIGPRLDKTEMRLLWNNTDFVEHCRKQIIWYSDFAPAYRFPHARFGKFRFPRWR